MPAPLKVLHFADLHIGMENYGKIDPQTGTSTRIRDFVERLDEIVDYAISQAADLVIFAGDAFRTRDPDPTQQREFAKRIKRLAAHVPVFMLVGNHDIPGMAARATAIDIFTALEVSNVTVGRRPGSKVIDTRSGPVFMGWVPFPVRGRLLAQDDHRGASVEALDRAVEDMVNTELATLATQAGAHDMPRLLVGHFSVSGATYGAERSVMLGRDLVVQKSALADPAWDYVALGHIHLHQNLTPKSAAGLPPIVYSGSLERVDFGEEAQPKGFCWVRLARGDTRWEFVPVKARPFRTIRVDARQAEDATAAAVAAIEARDIAGAVVRVQICLREGQEASLDRRRIERALAPAMNTAAIQVEVEHPERIPGLGLTPESLTPTQWLERYLAARNKPPEHIQRLLAAAQELLEGDRPE